MSRKLSLPFTDIIAPDSQTSTTVIKPPAYATKTGFSFNLNVLAGVPLILKPGQSFDFTKLSEGSTLDEAQQLAVIQILSTGLALIQGPPGTGKSYTGVAIIKVLLRNRKAADLGPIICVCYTNHALDQLLENLVKDGVMQVIRLGSRSKSDLLRNLTLRHVAEKAVPTKTEKHDKWEHNRDIGETLRKIEDILSGLRAVYPIHRIDTHQTFLTDLRTKHSLKLGLIVYKILRRGAAVDLSNNEGITPLMVAATFECNIPFDMLNSMESSKWDCAGGRGLFENASRVAVPEQDGHYNFLIHCLLGCGASPNAMDATKRTALHYAVESKSLSTMRDLLQAGASMMAIDSDGNTPLMLAALRAPFTSQSPSPFSVMMDYLAAQPSRIAADVINMRGPSGRHILHVAMRGFKPSPIIHRILKLGNMSDLAVLFANWERTLGNRRCIWRLV